MGAGYRDHEERVSPELRRQIQTNAVPARAARMDAGSSLMMPWTPAAQSRLAFAGSFTVQMCVTTCALRTARTIDAIGNGMPLCIGGIQSA